MLDGKGTAPLAAQGRFTELGLLGGYTDEDQKQSLGGYPSRRDADPLEGLFGEDEAASGIELLCSRMCPAWRRRARRRRRDPRMKMAV